MEAPVVSKGGHVKGGWVLGWRQPAPLTTGGHWSGEVPVGGYYHLARCLTGFPSTGMWSAQQRDAYERDERDQEATHWRGASSIERPR